MIALVLCAAVLQAQAQGPSVLDRAEDAIDKQDYSAARTFVAQALQKQPENPRALYDLGYIELESGHAPEAETDLRRALKAQPELPQAQIALGRALAAQNKPDEAIAAWRTVTGSTTASPALHAEAYRAIAATQADRKDYESARNALVEALKLTPETPADTLLAAQLAEAMDDSAAAAAEYRKVLASAPGNVAASAALGRILRSQEKYPEAETVLRDALKASPDNVILEAQLASTLALEDKAPEAITLLKAAHARDPQNQAITRLLADIANQQGADPALAVDLNTELLKAQPGDPVLLAALGASLIRAQRYPEAITALKQSLAAGPDNPEAWGGLAFAAEQTRQWPLVIQALTERTKYAAQNASTYFLLGQAYDKLRHNKEAAENYRQFLALAGGKFPDQEFQVRHRLIAMAHEGK